MTVYSIEYDNKFYYVKHNNQVIIKKSTLAKATKALANLVKGQS